MDPGWVAGISSAIAVLVGVVAFFATRQFSALQSERDIRRAWMDFDLKLLENRKVLTLVDNRLNAQAQTTSFEERQWRWICYAVRNPLENYYMSIKDQKFWRPTRRVCRSAKYPALVAILSPLVSDPQFMNIVESFSADPEFKRVCQRVARQVYCQAKRAETPTDACGKRCYARSACARKTTSKQ